MIPATSESPLGALIRPHPQLQICNRQGTVAHNPQTCMAERLAIVNATEHIARDHIDTPLPPRQLSSGAAPCGQRHTRQCLIHRSRIHEGQKFRRTSAHLGQFVRCQLRHPTSRIESRTPGHCFQRSQLQRSLTSFVQRHHAIRRATHWTAVPREANRQGPKRQLRRLNCRAQRGGPQSTRAWQCRRKQHRIAVIVTSRHLGGGKRCSREAQQRLCH